MSDPLPPPCTDPAGVAAQSAAAMNTRGTLIATVVGSSLAFIVGSIVNVALPRMQAEFGTGPTGAQWIVNAYLLPLGALVLIGGALGDRYGRRRIFLTGLAVFTLACGLCAVAWSFPVLLAGRALEGVGAAMFAPTSLAIIADGFHGKARGAAIGTWAASGAAAGALAPLIGGLIVDSAGWRWAFGAIIPVAAFAFWQAWRSVRESRAPSDDRAPLDLRGAGLSGAGLLATIWALIALPERGATFVVLAALCLGLALLAAFVAVEHRLGDRAMMPLALFARPTFAGLSLLTLFLYAALGGLLVLLPYTLISELDYSATQAGAAILPFPLVLGLLSRTVGGALADRFGPRALLIAGSLMVTVGFALFAAVPPDSVVYWQHLLPPLLVLALGMAASVAPLTTAVLNSAGARFTGVASGVNNAISRVAGLTATALLGLVLIGSAENLLVGFAAAAWVGVALALASAAAAVFMVGDDAAE
ncbi:Multidrug resistance protein stp [Rhodobacteraceae bacterium THAF1]|uniref:MFS transporter n=1 Tax=Palleronia sp. THAF1 TaxID=2587842 RepID=UPI000F3D3D40|nr:MFS transporter [Palleronia sp. THAF1]QFU08420.1 Multidrug resistance protein stp [Palleronia sp. THAF1]VDC29238.1 Multidrug resistance protein stp [Rhodobacteraceae bacterium THAF1]